MIEEESEIVFNKEVANSTFYMGLRSPEIVAIARPGQFAMLRVTAGIDPLLRRPFSICGLHRDEIFYILYRIVGRGTELMSRASKGERLSVLGPLGKGFELPLHRGKSLLVAGGIGIAPLIFLAQTLDTDDATFLAGYRSANDIIPTEQVGLDLAISIATDDGTAGRGGTIIDLLKGYAPNIQEERPIVFACGPSPMLREVAALANHWRVPCQVSLETSMACGLGACQGCSVRGSSGQGRPYRLVCHDGPVFDVNDIDWKSI